MKFSLIAACTLAVAVAESAVALPFPSDYQGAHARDLEARDLEARAYDFAFDDSYLAARSPLGRSKSMPSMSKGKEPATGGSIPLASMNKPSSSGSSSSGNPPAVPPKDKGKAPATPPKNPSRPQPNSAAQTEEQRKAEHDKNTLATAQASLAETQQNNAATQSHNGKMRKIGYAGLGLSTLAGATAIGLGVNSAIETHNRDQAAQQAAQQKAQAAAQPARRAIIDGEVYELYWVN